MRRVGSSKMAAARAVCCCCSSPTDSCLDDASTAAAAAERRPLLQDASLLHSTDPALPHKDYESLDYDRCYNTPYMEMIQAKHKEDKHFLAKIEVLRWVLMFLIGFLTAMVALFIDGIVKELFKLKFGTVDKSIEYCSKEGCLVLSLLMLLGFNILFITIAAIITALEPIAAGSGIPEIKCYLNGVKIPRVVRFRTLCAKVIGVLFSVAGGLFVGKEGPMIHSGAVIGAGVPQFESFAGRRMKINFPYFRSDRDKRDFVSSGAAAGVAAAFGAPIGGVLFSLEEGSSFWNQKLTWRTFFCSMAATFSLNFFLSGFNQFQWGYFYQPGLINFGEFKCRDDTTDCRLWSGLDLFIFIAMGVVGGLLGGLFNSLNKTLTRWRMRNVHRRHNAVRVLEAILVVAVTTTLAFVSAMTLGTCKQLPVGNSSEVYASVRTYFCKDGEYNDMATLFFNSQETAIKQLFHQEGRFSMPSLAIFFLLFFFLACWTYGTSVPSGLFVPSLLCGAAYGRFVASILQSVGYTGIYSGTFALVGAAAFLGGVVRMTISLTVILIESTNQITYGLPIMIVLMVAKWFGDLFNEGLYDVHIELKNVPLLGWEAPQGMDSLRACDVMSEGLSFLYTHSRVQTVIDILSTTKHHAYPVVSMVTPAQTDSATDDKDTAVLDVPTGRVRRRLNSRTPREMEALGAGSDEEPCLQFHGLILRSQLIVLLQKGVFYLEHDSPTSQPHVDFQQLSEQYPRYPDIHDLDIVSMQHSRIMDLRQYLNPCPYTVFPLTPLPQIFNLFRSMGLRHLPVINRNGLILGVITRHNLTEEFLHDKQRERLIASLMDTTTSIS